MKKFAIIGFAATALLAGCSASNQTESEMDEMEPTVDTQPSAENYEVIVDPKSGKRTVIDRSTGEVVR